MIHPSAIIHASAQIADDVKIGPFCKVGKDVVIESGCDLQSYAICEEGVILRENVKIFSYSKLGNEKCKIEVGKNTHIREFCLIGTQTKDSDKVNIENDCFIMAYTQLYPGVTLGANSIITNAVTLEENVSTEEKVIIGGLSTVTPNIVIGTGVMIGGASKVDSNLPPFCLVEGNSASVKGLNIVGIRRRFEDKEEIESIKSAFKTIFRGGVVNMSQAKSINKISESQKNVEHFTQFIIDNL